MEACYRKKEKHRPAKQRMRWRIANGIIVFVCVIGLVLYYLNKSVLPAMSTLAEARVKAIAIQAMNDSILLSLTSGESYATFTEAMTSGEKIYMVTANPTALNKLASECSSLAQSRLVKRGDIGIAIPVGTLSGVALLSGRGPDVVIKFEPASTVHAGFTSQLTNSGINQSLYQVKILLSADMYVVLPGKSFSVSATCEAVIAENVIVGEVPQVYTNVPKDSLDNFIPTEVP